MRPSFLSWRDVEHGDGFPSFPDWSLLAEGDSWFTVSGTPPFNLLFELRFNKAAEIVNLALPGDHIRKMGQICRNRTLRDALSPGGRRWDAILLSGGGNDVIADADEIILDIGRRPADPGSPAEYCDGTALDRLIDEIQNGYREIVKCRDVHGGAGERAPIVTHTYDYATARNAPAGFLLTRSGPWLFPTLQARQVPNAHWQEVCDFLIDTLADGILALAQGPNALPSFHVVDTRGTLVPADPASRGNSQDWQNEIHPNGGGYEKLAKKVAPVIESVIEKAHP